MEGESYTRNWKQFKTPRWVRTTAIRITRKKYLFKSNNRTERLRKNLWTSRKVGFSWAESTAITNPTEKEVETVGSTVAENDINEKDFNGVRIVHEWYSKDSIVQKIVNYSYKLGWYDFLAILECENGRYDVFARWDKGHAYGLCQINDLYHKDIPQEYFDWVWQTQVEYCYQKWKAWTVFYGPNRIIKWKKCYEYVKDRFTFIE